MNRVSTTERSGQYERKFSNVCGRVNSAHRDDAHRVSPRSHSRIFCVISDSRPDRVGSALLLRIDSGTRLVDTVPLAVFSGANPMKTQSTSSLPALTEKWIREHLELDQWVSELVARMDVLYEKLMQLEPPFASWQDAVQQIGLFVDVLEQHEEQESENIHWLSP